MAGLARSAFYFNDIHLPPYHFIIVRDSFEFDPLRIVWVRVEIIFFFVFAVTISGLSGLSVTLPVLPDSRYHRTLLQS
jgi:hypothetical protein